MNVRLGSQMSTLRGMLVTSFVLSGLTVTVLIVHVTNSITAKPFDFRSFAERSQSYNRVMTMMDIGREKTQIAREAIKKLQTLQKETLHHRRGSKRVPKINNVSRVDQQVACHMTVVVRGYILHFRAKQPTDRAVWCPDHSCVVSVVYSSNFTDILGANVTFFSHLSRLPRAKYLYHLVEHRRPDQRYVLMSYETPLRVARNTTLPARLGQSFYHWMATYDPSSDIPFPYGEVRSLLSTDGEILGRTNYFKSKTNWVAFVSSNCVNTKWRRLDFVLELQKFVPVDIYGLCGNLTCEVGSTCTELLRGYKFILALENSPCKGYISEKFWNAIWQFQSVAIAWGADSSDYEKSTPPGSYIYVEDFKSVEALAGFIKEVGGNETLYNGYHKWRTNYRVEMAADLVEEPTDRHICKLVDRYITETANPDGRKIRYRNTNGMDWIKSCRIPVHTKMEAFPIPVR